MKDNKPKLQRRSLVKIDAMPVHPAADYFPMMTDEKLEELIDDIDKNDQQEPVIVANEMLVDGRNRLAACRQLGLERIRVKDLGNIDDAKIHDHVASLNLHRRQMSKQEAANAALRFHEHAKATGRPVTLKKSGEMFGVSSRTVSYAKKRREDPKPQRRRSTPKTFRSIGERIIKQLEDLPDPHERRLAAPVLESLRTAIDDLGQSDI